jgi:predicted nucleic acid-binding protein
MPTPRRLWDSCTIIDYLAGTTGVGETCAKIIEQAERGELEILVSAVATIEVAYLQGSNDEDSEARIRELFGRSYIIPVAIDVQVASTARELTRKYRHGPKIKPLDAAHLATAIQWKIPLIETTDPDLLRLDGREGQPRITIRPPLYEGPDRMPGFR